MANIEVDKNELYSIYKDIQNALGRLELLIASVGCLHVDSFDITTMDGSGLRRTFCNDCGVTIEEEMQDEQEKEQV